MKSTGRKGWEAATSRSEQFACKSEDLPVMRALRRVDVTQASWES